MKIFLIGLPGCGKTTLGKKLADLLGQPFVDLDVEIVKGENQSVENIFSEKGESQFRILEKDYLMDWCQRSHDFVMATGGGTPCYFDNMNLINKSGVSVFLDVEAHEIADRMLKTELAKRPLLAGQDASTIVTRVESMRAQRIDFYNRAQLKVEGEEITAKKIANEILGLER